MAAGPRSDERFPSRHTSVPLPTNLMTDHSDGVLFFFFSLSFLFPGGGIQLCRDTQDQGFGVGIVL